ncbi:hypothetical protein JXA05_01605 [Candidatus Peregrinibacteria bacterium]|nr:hypothetical protein [Candidatus Peregrinibacteria bacterium]
MQREDEIYFTLARLISAEDFDETKSTMVKHQGEYLEFHGVAVSSRGDLLGLTSRTDMNLFRYIAEYRTAITETGKTRMEIINLSPLS